jgi:hypothetical protein
MSNRGIIDADAAILSLTSEFDSRKGWAKIYDDPIGHVKLVHNVLHELDCLCSIELDEWLVLYPLGELVDSHVDVFKTTWRVLERSYHVKLPSREGP